MYRLYFSKKNFEFRIEPIGNLMTNLNKITNEPTVFNNCYYVCDNRKALKDLANQMKNKWICEAKEMKICYENIEIKSKY